MTNRGPAPRRTVLQTLGALAGLAVVAPGAVSARSGEPTRADCDRSPASAPTSVPANDEDVPRGADRYVAVVDRIVDGEHVVLLLEEEGELVDQLVVDRDEFDDVAERDILIVVVRDGELLAYRVVDERPEDGVIVDGSPADGTPP